MLDLRLRLITFEMNEYGTLCDFVRLHLAG